MNALKTFLWSVFVPGTLTTIVPYLILSNSEGYFFELSVFRFIGIIPILFGAMLYFWCAWSFTFVGKGTPAPFDAPKQMVATGAYQFTRNPMYVACVSVLIGEAVFFESAALSIYAFVLFLIFHIWILIYEEPTLRKKFGASYEAYCSEVSRWIPFKKNEITS